MIYILYKTPKSTENYMLIENAYIKPILSLRESSHTIVNRWIINIPWYKNTCMYSVLYECVCDISIERLFKYFFYIMDSESRTLFLIFFKSKIN